MIQHDSTLLAIKTAFDGMSPQHLANVLSSRYVLQNNGREASILLLNDQHGIDIGMPVTGLWGIDWQEQGNAWLDVTDLCLSGLDSGNIRAGVDASASRPIVNITLEFTALSISGRFRISQMCIPFEKGGQDIDETLKELTGTLESVAERVNLLATILIGSDAAIHTDNIQLTIDQDELEITLEFDELEPFTTRLINTALKLRPTKQKIIAFANQRLVQSEAIKAMIASLVRDHIVGQQTQLV